MGTVLWQRMLVIVTLLLLIIAQGCTTSTRHATIASGDEVEVDGRLVDMGDGTCENLANGKMWQQGHSKRLHSIAEAREYVEKLRVGGYDDWRLPTVAELYDLHLFLMFMRMVIVK